jgi:hypothetical protein
VLIVQGKIAKLERLVKVFEGYRDSGEPFIAEARKAPKSRRKEVA